MLSHFKRLTGYLLDNSGEVTVEVTFGNEVSGVRYAKGELKAEFSLTCQRCLKPMRLRVENEFCLALIENENEADQLPEHFDPIILDPLVVIHATDLFEDELILCLPLVAKHTGSEFCSEAEETDSESEISENDGVAKRKNPFAVLENFNKAKQKH
ncbi:MAG: YceD family protein [Gammaproteobacteria bacterium]|nr:YceD family protein [Gammaproteobacteria bacterium]